MLVNRHHSDTFQALKWAVATSWLLPQDGLVRLGCGSHSGLQVGKVCGHIFCITDLFSSTSAHHMICFVVLIHPIISPAVTISFHPHQPFFPNLLVVYSYEQYLWGLQRLRGWCPKPYTLNFSVAFCEMIFYTKFSYVYMNIS